MANVPAHLRTDFSFEDADIKTLVQNVLAGRRKLQEVRSLVENFMRKGIIPSLSAKEILDIINQGEEE